MWLAALYVLGGNKYFCLANTNALQDLSRVPTGCCDGLAVTSTRQMVKRTARAYSPANAVGGSVHPKLSECKSLLMCVGG